MKRVISIAVPALLIVVISFLGYHVYRTIAKKEKLNKQAATLPPFSFYKQDATVFNNDSLQDYKGRVIIQYFSADCDHCQYMAKAYTAEKEKLGSSRILMVTFGDSASTAKFCSDYQLNTMPNIIVLRDPQVRFPSYFGTGAIPCFFVYKEHRLVNKFIGETKVSNLLSDTLIKL
jgi:thiol-disulfide isomerase/thioredoxin